MKPYIISHMMESVIACNITFDFLSVRLLGPEFP